MLYEHIGICGITQEYRIYSKERSSVFLIQNLWDLVLIIGTQLTLTSWKIAGTLTLDVLLFAYNTKEGVRKS